MAAVSYEKEKASVTLEPGPLSIPKSTREGDPGEGIRAESSTKLSFMQRVRTFGAIEAYLFLSLFSLSVKALVDVRLTFIKACVTEVGLSYDECKALDESSKEYMDSDKIATWYIMVSSWVSTVVSMVMGILIGSFCDKYQRKIPLVLVPLGFAVESTFSMLAAIFIDSPLFIIVASKAPANLSGGPMIVMSGTYAYISQVAAPKARQIRFAILQMLLLGGVTFGTVTGGFLFQEKNYVLVYSVSIATSVLGMILLAVFMEERNSKTKGMTYGEIARAFFSFDAVKESYRLVVAPREGNRRLQLWLLFVSSFAFAIPAMGTRDLTVLYVRKRYSWDTQTTAYVTGALRLGTAAATITGVRVFTKKLKLRDPIIALIGFSSLAADYLCRGLASTGFMYGMSYAVGALNGCSTSASDSLLTRLLNENELGKVFVFKSLIDSASPAVGTSFFSTVSREFESSIPGILFISSAMWIVIPISIMIWILLYGTLATPTREETASPDEDIINEDRGETDAQSVRELRRDSFICRI